jgi:hypothetical protein
LDEVPEGSLIEPHYISWVIVIGGGCSIIGEESKIPVAVLLLMQIVQVVGGEICLGLWIGPEVSRKYLRGVGYFSSFHIPIDTESCRFEDLKHPLRRIRMLTLQTIQIPQHIIKICFKISHSKKEKGIETIVAGSIIDKSRVHQGPFLCHG